ncbi:nucleotidyltransferase family protein [Pseudonocardia sp. KRD-184]|uniref:Nucleotidyltransferase family protein n=2 Tax=Pseudonocardia oceani TaxID=2792013 RepID=A0ABS6U7W8_9PSEU|nr:nucleotidyltransferase family protein [Pseudonocardia oceani]MBW0098857.1 nucleotidyltransferase family protein [Pseudonocardia oceani]MBW0112910.1 nucleotidyltransferase family protein [Pseudonocardia oceani]MBW0123098.1 nucleotidyltransferase family protein [Pseudonocardia oceani]MBW0128301.1 nucleotidyltransferase family protein [Pseudonocardia oceani]
MGRPKALVEIDGEPLVRRALRVLADGGCAPLVVVLGAAADDVRSVLPAGVRAVEAPDWESGMGASLRAGLSALGDAGPDAALVHLVDLPGVTAEAVARLVAGDPGPAALRRAAYDGRLAHPVLLGRSHWPAVVDSATGDAGARAYLRDNPDVEPVECGDVAVPDDVDTPEALARFTARSGA